MLAGKRSDSLHLLLCLFPGLKAGAGSASRSIGCLDDTDSFEAGQPKDLFDSGDRELERSDIVV